MDGVEPNSALQRRAEAVPTGRFLGGPRRDFEKVGRHTFELLLAQGLRPHHKVLDVGCGALRVGYWLIHFLEPESYYGIEPKKRMLGTGRKALWLRDYKGDEWIGNTKNQKQAGLAAHSTRWIKQACEERGLTGEVLKGEVVNRQRWMRITTAK